MGQRNEAKVGGDSGNITLTEIGVMASNTKGTAIAAPFVLFGSRLSYWQFSRWGVDSEVRMVSSG